MLKPRKKLKSDATQEAYSIGQDAIRLFEGPIKALPTPTKRK
jgi:hypothetical protein